MSLETEETDETYGIDSVIMRQMTSGEDLVRILTLVREEKMPVDEAGFLIGVPSLGRNRENRNDNA